MKNTWQCWADVIITNLRWYLIMMMKKGSYYFLYECLARYIPCWNDLRSWYHGGKHVAATSLAKETDIDKRDT